MTMRRRTTGKMPGLIRNTWNELDEELELEEFEIKNQTLKIKKEHQSHPIAKVESDCISLI